MWLGTHTRRNRTEWKWFTQLTLRELGSLTIASLMSMEFGMLWEAIDCRKSPVVQSNADAIRTKDDKLNWQLASLCMLHAQIIANGRKIVQVHCISSSSTSSVRRLYALRYTAQCSFLIVKEHKKNNNGNGKEKEKNISAQCLTEMRNSTEMSVTYTSVATV